MKVRGYSVVIVDEGLWSKPYYFKTLDKAWKFFKSINVAGEYMYDIAYLYKINDINNDMYIMASKLNSYKLV